MNKITNDFDFIPCLERLEYFKDLADQFPDGYIRVWLGYAGFVHIHKPEHLEVIFAMRA